MRPTIDMYFFELPLYSALVALGTLVGLLTAYLYLRRRSRRLSQLDMFLDGALLALVAGWIGARAYHIVMNWSYYQLRTDEIIPLGGIREGAIVGGLGMRGAFSAALLVLWVYARWRRLGFSKMADAAALGLAIGQAIGWVGAFVHGANYGVVSDSRIAMELPDLYGLVAPRFPLQIVEILLFALVFVGLLVLTTHNWPAGTLFLVYLFSVSLANFVLGFQRGDETAYWGALRVDQIVDASLGALALAWLLGRRRAQYRMVAKTIR